jgi:UDP-N-acetyl-D-glucosamine dehydrogenase
MAEFLNSAVPERGPLVHRPVGVGVIGAGYWGAKHIRNFVDLPEADLQYVADLDSARLAAVARQYPRLRTTAGYHDLIQAPDLDAIVVATPAATHVAIARAALRAGKHVLVEKPLATSIGGAEELIALAEEHDRVLMVGHTFLYNPAVRTLRDLVQGQELGDIYYVHAQRLNLGLFQRDVNVIWDLAPHDVSILMYVLGADPITASARGWDYVQPGIHDVAYLDLEFPHRVRAALHVSWLDPNKTRHITIVGSRKMAVYDDVATLEKIRVYDKGVDAPPHTDSFGEFQLSYRYGNITIPHLPGTEPLRVECAHFVECVQTGARPLSDGQQGLAVVRVLEAAQASLLDGSQTLSVHGRSIPLISTQARTSAKMNGSGPVAGAKPLASIAAITLEDKLRGRHATVAIIGLGYAGLPMAVEIARAGFQVICYDVDQSKVDLLGRGVSPISSVLDADVQPLHQSGALRVTSDARLLAEADVAIICVPTPLTADGQPDMQYVLAAASTLAQHVHRDMLVVLQSTATPGATTRLVGSAIQQSSGLVPGRDFHLVFAPERIDPGNAHFTVANTPKLVGGISADSTRLACIFFESFIDEVVPVGSPEIAEMAKLFENTFRFVNISLANELALVCDRLGVNVWEVIEAAKTKPFAFLAHYPSAGVGGHCIPVVPRYLEAAAREHGLVPELIGAARRVNDMMPGVVVGKLERALAARGQAIAGARILLVGITYKPDVADIRNSAALQVLDQLVRRLADVAYHDPLVQSLDGGGRSRTSVALTAERLGAMDAVVLLTPHSAVDYDAIVRQARFVLDTHSRLRPRTAANLVNIWVPSADTDAPAVLLSAGPALSDPHEYASA